MGKVSELCEPPRNVLSVFCKAAELVCSNLDTYHKQLKETRDYLEEQLTVNGKYLVCDNIMPML